MKQGEAKSRKSGNGSLKNEINSQNDDVQINLSDENKEESRRDAKVLRERFLRLKRSLRRKSAGIL